jgi:hypothetical protein
MLISELIQQLEKLDGNLPVIRAGYEGGVDDVVDVSLVTIAKNANTAWYYGKHEIVDGYGYREDLAQYPQVSAVYIN